MGVIMEATIPAAIGAARSNISSLLIATMLIVSSAAAKEPKPSDGSWRIEPLELAEPIRITVGKEMITILRQRLVPEAALLTDRPVQFGSYSLPANTGLIRVTTKQGIAWCSIEPLRVHPGKPKTSFAEALLMGRKIVERRETPCFADSNADGLLDTAMIGSDRGYLLPTIDKLGKAAPIAPLTVRETDPATLVTYPLELKAELATPKDEPPHLIFAITIMSGDLASQIEGFRLVGRPNDRTTFAMFSGVATLQTKFEEVVPATIAIGPVGENAQAEIIISQSISARRFALGNISAY